MYSHNLRKWYLFEINVGKEKDQLCIILINQYY